MKSVTSARAVPHLLGNRVDLSWQNPPASDFESGRILAGIIILRYERTYPLLGQDGKPIYGEVVYGEETPGWTINPGPVVSHFTDEGLAPLTTYYYAIYAVDNAPAPQYYVSDSSRVVAFATKNYKLAERLYKLLPAVHQRYDRLGETDLARLSPEVLSALGALPRELRGQGPLRRFLHATGAPFDLMRSLAEGLRRLHDVDLAPPEFLPLLAQWVGWELDQTLPVFAERNEIKFAPHYYRSEGTVPNLRALVNRYTGWHTQVAEFAQHIVRSNTPPQLNVFAIMQDPGGWRGTDDAAPALGFGTGTDESAGSGSLPATLVSALIQPFVLRPGMEVAITADNRLPVVVRFHTGDFANMAAALAAEVAAVLNRELSEVTATARADGRIVLASHTVGLDSSLRVERYEASLVTLEGGTHGRLSACMDNTPDIPARIRLFYETSDPTAPYTTHAAAQALSGVAFPMGLLPEQQLSGQQLPLDEITQAAADKLPCESSLKEPLQPSASQVFTSTVFLPSLPQGRLHYKTFRNGSWGESFPLTDVAGAAWGDPTAVEVTLPDGTHRILAVWVDNPNTDSTRLRFALGSTQRPRPASLAGRRSGPFAITPGTHLLLRGNWPEAESFRFSENDFATPQNITASQIEAVLNARLTRVTATAQPNQTLLLETTATGGDERLEMDLRYSSAAHALGFESANARSSGDWGDEIEWSLPQDIETAGVGRHADLHALADNAGVVWLFWATFVAGNWNIVTSRWNGAVWSPIETLASGPGGNREPHAVTDATNRIWLFWSRRENIGTVDDTWTLQRRVFDPTANSWGAEASITTPPVGERAADREPGAVRLPNDDLRVYFRSDRSGGPDIWSVTVTPSTNIVGALTSVTSAPAADHAPAPIFITPNVLWVLYRSDRSIPLFRLATRPLPQAKKRFTSPPVAPGGFPPGPLPSVHMADTGTLRRFAGATSVVLKDAARASRRRLWDDLLAYTAQKPFGEPRESLRDDDLYTRGTIGLYLSQLIPDSPLSRQMIERLRSVLGRFLPINVRAVVILAPRADIEFVYTEGADIQESYLDNHPFIEFYTGLGEDAGAPLPSSNVVVLLSNTAGHVTADAANLQTLRRRTFFPPLV